tara:strand:+ start:9915 stop:10685 length:771 start_codon:yes stop_codon:yes gene_type:complete
MKNIYLILIFLAFLTSCSSKKQVVYLGDINSSISKIANNKTFENNIEIGDILKIDVITIVPEAALPYTGNNSLTSPTQSPEILKLEGYLVDENYKINYPVLGEINVSELTIKDLENNLTQLLINGGHLTSPTVKVRRVNSKFTVLGQVVRPGTFSYFDDNLNLFQALGYAGDLTIDAKRNNIILIRESNGIRNMYKFSLTKSDLFKKPYYSLKNNDIIIVEPNYSKIKSAGFIGSPSSIAAISSLILSITLLIINK